MDCLAQKVSKRSCVTDESILCCDFPWTNVVFDSCNEVLGFGSETEAYVAQQNQRETESLRINNVLLGICYSCWQLGLLISHPSSQQPRI